MTHSQIAKLLGTSQVQVSRLEKRALLKMKENYAEGPIELKCYVN